MKEIVKKALKYFIIDTFANVTDKQEALDLLIEEVSNVENTKPIITNDKNDPVNDKNDPIKWVYTNDDTKSVYGIPYSLHYAISHLLFANRKIPAIKSFRQATGCGLKDAKNIIENVNNWEKVEF